MSRIALVEADIFDPLLLDTRQCLGDTVEENLAADEAFGGKGASLGGEVFATTKTNFKPNFAHRFGEYAAETIDWLRDVD